jgi:hypothetical protein
MIKKIIKYTVLSIFGLILLLLLILFSPGLWNHWIVYPRQQNAIADFQRRHQETPSLTELNCYRGVLHSHSYWSHDSEGTLATILPAAKRAGIDFIFLTDHPRNEADSFPRGLKGHYDGVLIEPGSEKHGFCAWPLDSVVLDWKTDRDTLIKEVVAKGGMFFYAHSEEEHNWQNPWYQGMEIYNIHTDTKDESLGPHILNFIVNGRSYRSLAMREFFDEQKSILALWDSLNQSRKIVGFSAVDAHENQNFRARYLNDGRVEWIGPNAKPIDTVEVSVWNRWLFEEPDEEGWICKFMVDTYEASFNHVTNYVLADTLSVGSIADHLKKGHLFIAFKSLADAKGFMFVARNREDNVSGILGDSIRLEEVSSLQAVSPLPGEFRLIHDGATVQISSQPEYEFRSKEELTRGVYRIEVHITLGGVDHPWIYSNPIYIY